MAICLNNSADWQKRVSLAKADVVTVAKPTCFSVGSEADGVWPGGSRSEVRLNCMQVIRDCPGK